MVAAENIIVNLGALHLILNTLGDYEIVNTPTSVLLASLEHIAPPAILHLFRMQIAEGIHKACGLKNAELFALLVRKASCLLYTSPSPRIDFLRCHIQITAYHHGLNSVQLLQIG